VSTPAPHPALAQAALRQAGRLGRRHGKAAVYWQIGDSSGADAQPFYRDLLRGISEANQEITGLYELPDLTARQDYDLDGLAADLGLARDDPGMAEAADTYLAAAREEFWLEAARLARRRLHPGPDQRAGDGDQAGHAHPEPGPGTAETQAEDEDDAEAEDADLRQDITDRASGLSRLLSERCSTCILPGEQDAPRPGADGRVRPAGTGRRHVCGLPSDSDVRGSPRLRPGYLPRLLRGVRRPVTLADPAACLPPPHRGPAAPARPAGWGRLTVRRINKRDPGQAAGAYATANSPHAPGHGLSGHPGHTWRRSQR